MNVRGCRFAAYSLLLSASLMVGCEERVEPVDVPVEVATPKLPEPTPTPPVDVQQTKDELGPGTTEQQNMLVDAKQDFLAQNWSQAATKFEKLIRTGPVSGPQVTAYIALGEIYQEQGHKEKAKKLHLELLSKAPKIPEVQFVVARSMAEAGETSRAIRAYEMTMKLQPEYLQAYVELGGLYSKAGRMEESAKVLLDYETRIYKMAKSLESLDAQPLRQLEILEVFSFIQDDRANQAIIASLDSPTPEVREKAVALTAEFKMTSVLPVLEKMAADDPQLRVRMISKEAISMISGVPVTTDTPTFVEDEAALPKPK